MDSILKINDEKLEVIDQCIQNRRKSKQARIENCLYSLVADL